MQTNVMKRHLMPMKHISESCRFKRKRSHSSSIHFA